MSQARARAGKWFSRRGFLFGLVALLLAFASPAAQAQRVSGNIVITGVNNLTGVNFNAATGRLTVGGGTVTGTLAGLPFTTQITNFALQLVQDNPATPAAECAILNLELGPINLALLGLFVDTSPICLEITAIDNGGLLGDLLCDLAGGNLPLLGGTLLQDILNAVLGGNAMQGGGGGGGGGGGAGGGGGGAGGGGDVCRGNCEILNLVLGPVDLTLLGLNVRLDNCNNGPVQVCISASRGQGILGDLLCGLTRNQLRNLTLADITQLIAKANELLADGSLSRQDIAALRILLAQLVAR